MTVDQCRTRRDAGECTGARGCDEERLPGRQRCRFHLAQQSARVMAWRARANRRELEATRRREWVAAGMCSKCGKVRVERLKQCKACRECKCASAKRYGWYTKKRKR